MMSLVSSVPTTDASKNKSLISEGGSGGGSGENSADPLQTPRVIFPSAASTVLDDSVVHRLIFEAASAPSSASIYFPSTAELMMPTAETIRKANPFDLSFGKANRMIGAASAAAKMNTPSDGSAFIQRGAISQQALLQQSGLIPASTMGISSSTESLTLPTSCSTAMADTASSFLSKLQLPSSLNHSPNIFSTVGLLGTDGNENALKTADFARLVQQMKESGGLSTQNSLMGGDSSSNAAPKTADVLNAVIDYHLQRQQNNLGSSLFNMPTPAGSAPNSAGVLSSLTGPTPQAIASVLASVASSSHTLFPTTVHGQPSPALGGLSPRELKKLSPKVLLDTPSNGIHPCVSSIPSTSCHSTLPSTSSIPPQTLLTALQQQQHQPVDPAAWDPHDVKPIVSGASVIYDEETSRVMANAPVRSYGGMSEGGMDGIGGPRSNDSCASSRNSTVGGTTSTHHSLHGSSGRGRGRSTADMPPDERRQTILERNKAAAVRYRKRKKEEHDDMITRCQQLEHERSSIMTQNAVLRREIDRLNAVVKEREGRCHCLRGIALPRELSERPPGDTEILEQISVYPTMASSMPNLMNGLHSFGGSSGPLAKRPLHKM